MDQEITSGIHKRTTVKPIGRTGNVNAMIKGKIDRKFHTVMFIRGEGQKCLFALIDKHLFSIACLDHILEIIQRCNQNSEADKKLFTDMLCWYIQFWQTLLAIIPWLFNVVKEVKVTQLK